MITAIKHYANDRLTVAATYDPQLSLGGEISGKVLRVAIARGSEKDQWSKKRGYQIALGRLASRIAIVLMGKHKAIYTPHVDTGDFVVVINAAKLRLTGKKLVQKMDFRHSGYPRGDRLTPYKVMVSRHPERVVELAVKGMLPKTKLGKDMLLKLRLFTGPSHPHQAQQPADFPAFVK